MVERASMETRRLAGFPADLLALLMLPAFAIFALLFGPQCTWLILLLIGLAEIPAGLFVLRTSRSSVSGWFAIAVGVIALAAGIRFALAPL
jgi:hypothetical protein